MQSSRYDVVKEASQRKYVDLGGEMVLVVNDADLWGYPSFTT